jgi:DNA-binding transcriptional MerR regulator
MPVRLFIVAAMNTETETRHSLEDLARLTEFPVRTIRYYIQEGLVARPFGEKRAAHYTARHLEQLLTIRKWQSAGLSLERIRELLSEPESGILPPPRPRGPGTLEVWSHVVIADGLEITLEPGRAGLSAEQVRAFARGVMALYGEIRAAGEEQHNKKEDKHA